MKPFPRLLLAKSLILLSAVASGQITVEDDIRRTVRLPSIAERIVSLAPSITETLFAIGAADQVVGVTEYCNYPPEARRKASVGGLVNPSIETIISLKPDLIVLSMEGNVREDFNKLVSFGIPVFVTNPRSLGGIHRSIVQLGALTGRDRNANELATSLQSAADSITALTAGLNQQRVLLFVSLQPIIVAGGGTFINELIELAGAINVAKVSSSAYPTYSRETVLKDDPDVLLFLSDIIREEEEVTKQYPEWSKLSAVRNGRILTIDADIVSRPGPRAVDGLRTLFHLLHTQHQ